MSKYLKVSASKMASDVEEMKKLIDELPMRIDEIETSMKKLSSCWEGEAWEAFQNQVNSDISNMNEMYNFLNKYLHVFGNAKGEYLRKEKDIYGRIDSVIVNDKTFCLISELERA